LVCEETAGFCRDMVDNAALWDFVVTKVPDLKKKAEVY
jgi:hypothetical protein